MQAQIIRRSDWQKRAIIIYLVVVTALALSMATSWAQWLGALRPFVVLGAVVGVAAAMWPVFEQRYTDRAMVVRIACAVGALALIVPTTLVSFGFWRQTQLLELFLLGGVMLVLGLVVCYPRQWRLAFSAAILLPIAVPAASWVFSESPPSPPQRAIPVEISATASLPHQWQDAAGGPIYWWDPSEPTGANGYPLIYVIQGSSPPALVPITSQAEIDHIKTLYDAALPRPHVIVLRKPEHYPKTWFDSAGARGSPGPRALYAWNPRRPTTEEGFPRIFKYAGGNAGFDPEHGDKLEPVTPEVPQRIQAELERAMVANATAQDLRPTPGREASAGIVVLVVTDSAGQLVIDEPLSRAVVAALGSEASTAEVGFTESFVAGGRFARLFDLDRAVGEELELKWRVVVLGKLHRSAMVHDGSTDRQTHTATLELRVIEMRESGPVLVDEESATASAPAYSAREGAELAAAQLIDEVKVLKLNIPKLEGE